MSSAKTIAKSTFLLLSSEMFDKIFSYLLSTGLAATILVLGLSLVYWQGDGIRAGTTEQSWPAEFTLAEGALSARSAVVYDVVGEQMLFTKNADVVLPLASLTKLIATLTVLINTSEDMPVTIFPTSLTPEGDWGFWQGESWPVSALVRFALAASSNDAAAALAKSLGADYVARINSEAQRLGLSKTSITNPTGLDESETTAGGYGSARDMAMLAATFMRQYPTYFEATSAPYVTISHGARVLIATSTAGPLLDIPGLIGAKTGYTDLAGGNLVAAFDIELGRPIVIAVLGSTRDGRFADVKTLIEATRRK